MTGWAPARSQNRSAYDTLADETADFIFQPDRVRSAQYFESLRKRAVLEPEQRLMLAILEEAVKCYQDNFLTRNRSGRRLFAEAESWIIEGGSDWIFSFDNVCDSLDLNPEYMRRGLLHWKEKNRQSQSSIGISGWEKRRANGS